MDLNLSGLGSSAAAGGFSPLAVSVPAQNDGADSGWNAGRVWGEVKDMAKFYTAAKYAPGSLTSAPVTPTTPSAPEAGKSLGDALAPVAAVFAANEANKNLNKNQPIWLYALLGFGLAFTYVVVNRKKG